MLTLEELTSCMLNEDFVYDGHTLYKVDEIKSTKSGTSMELIGKSITRRLNCEGNYYE